MFFDFLCFYFYFIIFSVYYLKLYGVIELTLNHIFLFFFELWHLQP